MSLELRIEELTNAIVALTAKIDALQNEAPAPVIAPAPAPAPVIAPAPAPAPVIAAVPAPVMPEPPVFVAPAPAPAPVVSSAPFNDGKGLLEYVMATYKEIGPERGAGIQTILLEMGLQNVNDLKPEQYGHFFTKVEALK